MKNKAEFPKVRCKALFKSKGADAAIALARELSIAETRLQRWIREWSDVPPDHERRSTYTDHPRPPTVDSNKPRVEIYPPAKGKKKLTKPLLGVVLEKGPEQSVVYIYDGPESLISKVQTFVNKDLKPLSKREP